MTSTMQRQLATLLIACAPLAHAAEPASTMPAGADTVQVPRAEMEKLVTAYALVKRNYVGETDDNTLFDGAIAGMLASLDAHSQYMSADDMRELDHEDSGDYVGIGIEAEIDRDRIRVVAASEDSPAALAGIQAGDLIASIDGTPLAGLSSSEVARRMRGAPGSVVTVGIVQGKAGKVRLLHITRAAMHNATVRTRMAAPGLAWIRVSSFGGATGADLAAALKQLDGKTPPRGLILDLRNDPGGLVPAAVSVAGAFLAPDTVLFSARGRVPGVDATVTVNPRYYKGAADADVLAGLPAWTRTVPLTVLVNGASASAAELVTGALQDQRRATVIGTRTFGKGSIQSVIPLGEDGVKFTVARYFTPNGREIQARGLVPDIVVAPKVADSDDLMLREADLANHLAPTAGTQVAADTQRDPVESTRRFGTRDDKALQAAVAVLSPVRAQASALAGLIQKWRAGLKPELGGAAGAP